MRREAIIISRVRWYADDWMRSASCVVARCAGYAFLLLLTGIGFSAQADAVVISGTVTQLGVYPTGQWSFRVWLNSTPAGCTGNFLYADTTFSNYQALVSTVTTAYSLGKNAQYEYNVVSGYCQIADVVTSP